MKGLVIGAIALGIIGAGIIGYYVYKNYQVVKPLTTIPIPQTNIPIGNSDILLLLG